MKNQLLLSVPTDVNVQWVNISSNEIDLLLVNDMFFDSPNIQRVIQQQKSYLRLVKMLIRQVVLLRINYFIHSLV